MSLDPNEARATTKSTPTDMSGEGQTLIGVLDEAAKRGFGAHAIGRDAEIECGSCAELVNPAAVKVEQVDRLEGTSDVADEMLIVSFECPRCAEGNTLTLGYGPNATESDQLILKSINLGPASTR